jgi:uncharacterized protein YlxP (DUF503 family)
VNVGVCRFTLLIAQSHSLKEKRVVLRRLKDRARAQGVTLTEVGGQDSWQRADLAFSVVAGERDRAQSICEGVLRQVASVDGGQIAAARVEVVGFGEDWYANAAETGRMWEAKAGEGDAKPDLSWVPDAWLTAEDDS